MTARLLPLLLSVLLASAWGRDAEDFFHAAAHRYVEGKASEALLEAEEGLRRHPGDARLQSLARHLREERERRQQNQGQGSPRPDGSGERSGDPGSGEQDRDGPQQDREAPPPDDANDAAGDRPQSGDGDPDDASDNRRPQSGESRRPGEMSREEAERLLNSFADDEKREQAGRRRAVAPAPGMEQTW